MKDDPAPEDGSGTEANDADLNQEKRKVSSQRFMKKRDQDLVDYISGGERIAREMRYLAETTEGERIGDWPSSATSSTNAAAMRKTRSRKHSFLYPIDEGILFMWIYRNFQNHQYSLQNSYSNGRYRFIQTVYLP